MSAEQAEKIITLQSELWRLAEQRDQARSDYAMVLGLADRYEEALGDIADIIVGFARPMTDGEMLRTICDIAQKALTLRQKGVEGGVGQDRRRLR